MRLCNSTPLNTVISQDVIQDATTSILDNYQYVDKTGFILKLLRDNPKRFFFARPRRFGKTMFLRTLQAAFDYERNGEVILRGTDLFKDPEYKWEKFPVLYFDLGAGTLQTAFNEEIRRFKEHEGITNITERCAFRPNNYTRLPPPEVQTFHEILCTTREYGKKRLTVVLVDQYDYHILKNLNNPVALDEITHFFEAFFTQIKQSAGRIKLAFVTGVTTSSFMVTGAPGGDFRIISDEPDYAELAGYTEDEFKIHFCDYISRLATERGVSATIIEQEVEDWYGGYTFTNGMEKMYNPESINNYFRKKEAKIYWADNGRTSFVWNQLKRRPAVFSKFKYANNVISKLRGQEHVNNVKPEVLLYEGGYLTIKEYHPGRANPYTLDFPNREVSLAFREDVIAAEKGAFRY